MRQLQDEFDELFKLQGEICELEKKQVKRIPDTLMDPSSKENISDYLPDGDEMITLKRNLLKRQERIRDCIGELLRYPPHFEKYSRRLRRFHENGSYEKSVFIMTKFPDESGDAKKKEELELVIKAAQEGVRRCGHIPRLAREGYDPVLWEHVELHLLGCSKGIAIVEDIYKPELNPNIAMEWGWMRRAGKEVLYLREKSFSHERADWKGLTEERFSWEDPEKDIYKAIAGWLGKFKEPAA